MFIQLNHKSLTAYQVIREMVKEVYKISMRMPPDERFNMTQQLRRAALSVKLNMAEGSSRTSIAERKRFYEISRGSLIEIDAVLETSVDLNYFTETDLNHIGILLNKIFALLTGLMNPKT